MEEEVGEDLMVEKVRCVDVIGEVGGCEEVMVEGGRLWRCSSERWGAADM